MTWVDAAERAVREHRHAGVHMAHFGSSPNTPEQVCRLITNDGVGASWIRRFLAAPTRKLEADLLAGHRVVRVHTRLMAGMRRGARERGKSDPIDAEAVARFALREDDLPAAELSGPMRDIKLYSDHRWRLVAQRTALQSKVRWFLHELDPDLRIPARALRRYCTFERVQDELAGRDGAVAEIARDMLTDITALTRRINELERHLATLVRATHPHLLAIPGMGVLSADDPRRDRRHHPLQDPRRLRPLQRHRTHPGLVGQHRPCPAVPRRKPAHQHRPAHGRSHPATPRR
jgi:hypothetical protein